MNRQIVTAVVVITGAGVVNSWLGQKPITPVIIGSYVFLFVLSVVDMYGGPASTLAGGLAMLAVTFVLLTEVPWTALIKLVGGNTGTGTSTQPNTGSPAGNPNGSGVQPHH